jgi:hypothetical protein
MRCTRGRPGMERQHDVRLPGTTYVSAEGPGLVIIPRVIKHTATSTTPHAGEGPPALLIFSPHLVELGESLRAAFQADAWGSLRVPQPRTDSRPARRCGWLPLHVQQPLARPRHLLFNGKVPPRTCGKALSSPSFLFPPSCILEGFAIGNLRVWPLYWTPPFVVSGM